VSSELIEIPHLREGVTLREIMGVIEKRSGKDLLDIIGPRRTDDLVVPRQIGYLLARELGMTFGEIGEVFGGRGKWTTNYGCEAIEFRIQCDPRARELYLSIRKDLA